MRTLLLFGIGFIFSFSLHAAEKDSLKHKLKASAVVTLNSNGIASIPAFSLDNPAVIATVSLSKNRFSYEPVLGYGLDLKPWFIDNWLNYKIINRPKFELRPGINFSVFFTPDKFSDTAVLKAERYWAYTITGIYKFTPATYFTLAYWSDNGQDQGTIRGHFINVMFEKYDFRVGRNVLLGTAAQLFYIDYDGNSDGLFISPKISGMLRNFPISVFFQCTQAITSNIDPFPEFRWNLGVGYTF